MKVDKELDKKEKLTIRISKELKNFIGKEADVRNISFNAMVNVILYDGLKNFK